MKDVLTPIAGVLLVAGIVSALPQPAVDLGDVVSRVRKARCGELDPSGAGFDNGRFLLDTGFVCKVAHPHQVSPVAAFDGTNVLVVWVDSRGGESDIYGCRLTPDGVLLDSVGIAVSTAPGTQWYPAVCSDDTGFLVAWWDQRGGASLVYACRVTSAGTVLDSSGIRVSPAASGQSMPGIAFDGTNFLVVWADSRSGSGDICGARVTPAGTVLDTAGLPVCTYWSDQSNPAVAFNGTDFLVAWGDDRSGFCNICASRVTSAGTVLDTGGICVSTSSDDQYGPAVGSDGTVSLVAWQDGRTSRDRIYAARLTPAGTVLDTAGIPLGANRLEGLAEPAVAFDGESFIVAWEESGGWPIRAARVTPAGAVLDSAGIPMPWARNLSQYSAAVCPGGNGSVVAWHEYDSLYNEPHIRAARVTRAGAVLDTTGVLLSMAAYPQEYPALAFDGTNYLAVWQDWRGASPDIYACRVTPGGTVLDPGCIPVCTVGLAQRTPSAAFDGTNFLVVWEDWRNYDTISADIYGARVTPHGTVLDPAGIPVRSYGGTQLTPVVGYNGTDFLVVWQRGLGAGGPTNIECARVTSVGVVLDSFIPVCTRVGERYNPAVAFDGTNALVVWADDRAGQYREDVYCARVTPAGVVLDTLGLPVCTATRSQDEPAVSFDGTSFLVVWQDTRRGTGHYDIYCARVTPGGAVIDSSGIPVCTTAVMQLTPTVSFDGTNYLVTWVDERNGSRDIYGARVSPGGIVHDTALVAGGDGGQQTAVLCRGAGNQVFLAFGDLARTVGGRTYNAQRIWGRYGLFPGVAEERLACQTQRGASGPTIVRGVLFLPEGSSHKPQAARLLDVAGRMVLDLKPGPNDVRRLAPGVYFVRFELSAVGGERSAISVRKVVLTR